MTVRSIGETVADIAYNHTTFDDFGFNRSEDISGVWNSKIGHLTLTTPT